MTYTVDAEIFTWGKVGDERYEAMAKLCHRLSTWIRDELGLYGVTTDTVGSSRDREVAWGTAKGIGYYWLHLAVEDTLVAKGDYRFRWTLDRVNDDMLESSTKDVSYSIVSGQVVARVAPRVRVSISEAFRALVRAASRLASAAVVG